MIAEDLGISVIGATWIDFRGRLSVFKYINLNLGWSISNFKDEQPFTESLVISSGQLSGLPTSGKSKIGSSSLYYSIGGKVPLVDKLHFIASVGQRKFSARRSIDNCSNCRKVALDIEAGNYLRSGFSWLDIKGSKSAKGELDLLYTHYFDDAFQYTISLGMLAYF